MLRQLTQLDEDYTNALVVLVDSRAARVYEVVLGGLLAEADFASEVPGRHKQGGWAQMRYQRHVKDYMDRHHREVAAYVSAYLTAHPQAHLIVSGHDNVVTNFRQVLPPPVQSRLLDTLRLDMHTNRQRLLAAVQEALQQHEREEEQASVQRVVERAGHGGLAVLGVQETLAAVTTARVHTLVMHRDVRVHGWRCLACGHLMAETHLQCMVCCGAVTTVELGEAMIHAVLQADGFVELVEPNPRLAAYEGVGAILRYRG
jgi:peptide chain release factor subunit 1